MRLTDRYRLVRRVGEGGGGGVYLVEDRLADGATMVLKRLHAQAQAGLAQWLVNEFQILAQLDLPTVARVHDFGLAEPDAEDPGGTFFTRAFVEGTPLDEALKGGALPDPAVVRGLFTSAASTLRELHRLGVVHGDLKPANLIVPPARDRAILIDFGLAHGALGAAERVRGGTLAYMPPERQERLFAGESLAPDPGADVYALAVSLVQVLGGEGSAGCWTPTDAVRASPAHQALWDIALRGASEEPSRRFATVDDLLVALGHDAPRERRSGQRVVLRPEGREAELGEVLDAVQRRLLRREGGPMVVLVSGEEGSGRSTLLRELTWRAQLRGVQVLPTPGEPGEAPFQRLLNGARILSGRAVDPQGPDALETAFREAARHGPVLLLADDLDRADPAIAARLRSVAYGCEQSEPLLLVASAEVPPEGFTPDVHVPLAGLELPSVASLCEQALGAVEPEVASRVLQRTAGLPLAVTELLAALGRLEGVTPEDVDRAEEGRGAQDLASRRVRGLDRTTLETGALVALLGPCALDARVRALAPSPEALDAARARGVVTVGPDGRWGLSHHGLEQSLLDALPASAREALQRSVAQALEGAPEASPAVRAGAWLRAGDALRAARHFPAAVEALRRDGFAHAAARLLASLRVLSPERGTPEGLLQEAELLHEAGLVDEAIARAQMAAEGAPGGRSARATLLLGRLRRLAGDPEEAVRLLTAVADAEDPALAAEAEVEAGRALMVRGEYTQAVERCERAFRRGPGDAVRASARALGGVALVYAGEVPRGVGLLEEARALYAKLSLPREEASLWTYLAVARERGGDLDGARGLYDKALERARAVGDLRLMAAARANLGHIAQRLGDLGACLEHGEAALRLAQRAGLRVPMLTARLNTAGQLLRIGSLDRARVELDQALALARETASRDMVAAATLMQGVARARAGDTDAGLGLIDEALAQFEALGQGDDAADALLDAAEVLLERRGDGDLPRAEAKLRRVRAAGEPLGLREARAKMLEGALSLARGEAREALKDLTEAVTLAGSQRDWEVETQALALRSQAHGATGAELHARRDRERSLEVLEDRAALLPPDLRGAFWSVAWRVQLRAEPVTTALASQPFGAATALEAVRAGRRTGLSVALGPGVNGQAPTRMAQDERLVLLLDLSRRLGEEHSLDRVLEQAVRSAAELTGAELGAVLLPGEDRQLVVRTRLGAHRGDGPDESFSRSIAETVWIDGEPVVTLNARGDRRFAEFRSVHDLGIGAIAAVPLKAAGRIVGVLYVENRRRRGAWTPSDLALLCAFGEQAGVAVENARLVEELSARSRELERAHQEIAALLETRTHELEATRTHLARAQEALTRRFHPAGLVAHTEAMRRVFAVIERVRETDVPVVIEGESGTGKELVARSLHFSGARAKGPFVVVHCGAIPETLLESELFGHVRGAFTGADRDRRGLLASAHGGTLLLDEVSEMPARMQVELLRVLQDRKVRPVGGERDELVDLRVVAACNRPLRELVAEGRFREDLYYRLAVVTVRIPPLRERVEDIPHLAAHFLGQLAEELHAPRKRLSREAQARLLRAPWPGNVRQLRHVLESAVVLSEDEELPADALHLPEAQGTLVEPPAPPPEGASASPLAQHKSAERQRILTALEQVNWNKVRAAEALNMPRRTLYRRLREYGLLE